MKSETFPYLHGYSIGVGGVVVSGSKVLLVRSAVGPTCGEWMIPGGFVERNETVEAAVRREVHEETGVRAEVDGLIAARSRFTKTENSAYFVFLMHASDEEPRADGVEVIEARFFTLADLSVLPRVRSLSKLVATRVLEGTATKLTFHPHPEYPADEFVLYL